MSEPLTSIVILAHNQRALTEACLKSIRDCTPERHELVLVDNGSADGTRALFERQKRRGAKVILNGKNLGYAAGCNQGLRAARGDYLLLLNNDVVVTEGWLGRLIAVAESDPQIGLAGPVTNRISGAQCIGDDHYRTTFGLELWGRLVARGGEASRDTHRLTGFCLLIKRAVLDGIGLLDERYVGGCFEDDDYCLRACQAGYRLVIVQGCFVHHQGSASFRAAGVDVFRETLLRNRQVFVDKWGALAKPYLLDGGLPPDHPLIREGAHDSGLLRPARQAVLQ